MCLYDTNLFFIRNEWLCCEIVAAGFKKRYNIITYPMMILIVIVKIKSSINISML